MEEINRIANEWNGYFPGLVNILQNKNSVWLRLNGNSAARYHFLESIETLDNLKFVGIIPGTHTYRFSIMGAV